VLQLGLEFDDPIRRHPR
jgi:hypothetical protein